MKKDFRLKSPSSKAVKIHMSFWVECFYQKKCIFLSSKSSQFGDMISLLNFGIIRVYFHIMNVMT